MKWLLFFRLPFKKSYTSIIFAVAFRLICKEGIRSRDLFRQSLGDCRVCVIWRSVIILIRASRHKGNFVIKFCWASFFVLDISLSCNLFAFYAEIYHLRLSAFQAFFVQ
ncbi:uncharacterized protein LOC131069677 isoform X1 [Cryptomeria japonica]|uniref:uncharacterized protein LOC131069677 isoform X1 n=1 Tax=Cryptomeria japonica TaxID=3369 RepID=UPI0027D9FD29|nr:uncharacterized protein LOC131069677 isoform X1 [Cryptomeria japonica]